MKWYTYLICLIMIIFGTFCTINLYKEIKAESYINGSIDISNQFSQETFNYTASQVSFSFDADTDDTYIFEKDLLKVDDFNGEKKQYKVMLNDFILIDVDIKAGSIYSPLIMDFYDIDGNVICQGKLNLSIKFLSGKTTLTLSCIGEEEKSFFEQYFYDNGINLNVVEVF